MINVPAPHDGTATPAVAYAAKSSADHRGSIAGQLAAIRAATDAEHRSVVAEYHDEAASAFHGNRGPQLAAALDHAERLAAEHGHAELWCLHPDRLARGDGLHAAHLIEYVLRARKASVQLRAVEHDDTFRDLIRAVLTGERNHEDSARKAAATQAGKRRAAERGEFIGGICPDGYQVIREIDGSGRVTRRVELDPERVEIYRLHFELALAGWSDGAIVLELDRRGYRTRPRKAGHKPRPFDANRVGQTLCMPFYAGLNVHRGQVVAKGNWTAIVSVDDFERIQAQRRQRAHADKPRTGRPPEGYVLARVAACGECGSPMDVVTGRHARQDGTRPRRYVCRTHRQRSHDCAAKPIDAAAVDRAFVDNLDHFLGDVELWRSQLVASREADRARLDAEIDRANQDLSDLDRTLQAGRRRYAAALAAGDDDRAESIEDALIDQRHELRRARTRLQAAQAALDDVAADRDSVDPLLDFFNTLRSEIAGRIKDVADTKRINRVVQDYFGLADEGRVTLTATPAGIEILPVLTRGAATRILLDEERWPLGIDVGETTEELHRAADLDEETRRRFGLDDDEDEILLRRTPVEVRHASTILATEPTSPPLRVIRAMSQNAPSPW